MGENSFRGESSNLFEFGETPPPNSLDMLGHLFASQGQLLVIQTRFEEGGHVSTSASQAVTLIQDLKSLHKKGLCHGDIRGYNCVFSDTRSYLIDFDFGGLAGQVTYPEGCQTALADGLRVVMAEDRDAIQKWHDVYALVGLLLNYHYVRPGQVETQNLICLNNMLPHYGEEISNFELDKKAKELLDKLEDFFPGKSIQPTPGLSLAVKMTEFAEKKTLGGFGGTPEHRKKK